MFKRIFIFVVLAYTPLLMLFLVGCEEEESYYSPHITGVDTLLHRSSREQVAYQVPATKTYYTPKSYKKSESDTSVPYGWKPSSRVEKDWDAIIIHHSGTSEGCATAFDNYHRNEKGWSEIGYNFVIGNGTGSGNGRVETTSRWQKQKTGAHCKTGYSNWANKDGIGICLVGNFDESRPSRSQMESLSKLVRFLSERYDIPAGRIYGHNTTPGHITETSCPGENFPMNKLKATL
ncbi:MAG: N-acetylmuramoyl-L-alanine amidase [Sedimentisphaerales bacterium]|nr:N-acetylmuramoyl-L-alanine amidase [Sedimentisphaerales bacterium]